MYIKFIEYQLSSFGFFPYLLRTYVLRISLSLIENIRAFILSVSLFTCLILLFSCLYIQRAVGEVLSKFLYCSHALTNFLHSSHLSFNILLSYFNALIIARFSAYNPPIISDLYYICLRNFWLCVMFFFD